MKPKEDFLHHFFWANLQKADMKIFSWTQCEISKDRCDCTFLWAMTWGLYPIAWIDTILTHDVRHRYSDVYGFLKTSVDLCEKLRTARYAQLPNMCLLVWLQFLGDFCIVYRNAWNSLGAGLSLAFQGSEVEMRKLKILWQSPWHHEASMWYFEMVLEIK